MRCRQCGQEIRPSAAFCTTCGAPVYQQQPPAHVQYSGFDTTPISMWGYFGYNLLFAIPIIGFILILVFSFGGTKNINLRNYARSTFCWFIILVILVAVLIFTGALYSFR